MNDFFARQDEARRKSGYLVFHFAGALLAIVVLMYLIILVIFGSETKRLFVPELFLGVTAVTSAILGFGSLYKTLALRQGGASVASMMGGELIQTNTTDPLLRRVLNLVEEMAIASGVPMPPVFLMPHEKGINAFAAGYNPDDAVVGVTRGAVETLTRDELQGVIAHEFSHILNGDMRLNIRLIGWVHGILLIHIVGYWVFRGSLEVSQSRDGAKIGIPLMAAGVAFMALGLIGVLFGRMIKSAVSRQREYMADASAVQFTRNPDGIGNALVKIGRLSDHSRIKHRRAEEISHMFFGSPFKRMSGLMSTHPPLVNRIQRILPHFDGNFPQITAQEISDVRQSALVGGGPVPSMLSHTSGPPSVTVDGKEVVAEPSEMLEVVGAPFREHLEASRRLISRLPDELLQAAREPFGSRALVYVLLLDDNPDIRERQLDVLRKQADQPVYDETLRLLKWEQELTAEMRLPLVDLSLGALRALSPAQYEAFRGNVEALSMADESISLFEYTLRHILMRHLDASLRKPRLSVAHSHSLSSLRKECSMVLSILTRHGHGDEETLTRAFHAASQHLPKLQNSLALVPENKCHLAGFHRALNRLEKLSFHDKKGLLMACLQCVTFDKKLTVTEAELFRAVADSLECPMPPWLKLGG